jgi:hypothetical protein
MPLYQTVGCKDFLAVVQTVITRDIAEEGTQIGILRASGRNLPTIELERQWSVG